jgi:hypothetical protein
MTSGGRDTRLQRTAGLCSQIVNVWVFDGEADETVSGRAWRQGVLEKDPIWARRRKRIDWVFAKLRDPDHCRKSHEKDVRFAHVILKPYGVAAPCICQPKPGASCATL